MGWEERAPIAPTQVTPMKASRIRRPGFYWYRHHSSAPVVVEVKHGQALFAGQESPVPLGNLHGTFRGPLVQPWAVPWEGIIGLLVILGLVLGVMVLGVA